MVTLESVELFRNLRPQELQALRQVTLERRYATGQDIFREGDPADGVYVVKSGRVEISGLINQTLRRPLVEIQPGGLFGEMAVIEHLPRSASATAAEDTTVYYIPRGEMLSFIERSPGLSLRLLQYISHRLREFTHIYLTETVQAERLVVVGRLARGIVHDLKNPLNIIGLTAELAALPNATPAMRTQATDRILRQIERINELVSEVLYFTQGSQTSVTLAPTDYSKFIQPLVEELRAETELKAVRLQLANAPPPAQVRLDPKHLRRVFVNLTKNATDMMDAGGSITMRFGQDDRGVVTEIADTGPGIAPEIVDRLFQTFATHGKDHGTGLGLSICKKIVEDHGGRIWARNDPAGGAVFSFALPRA